jgi:hypothetical protein
MDGAIREERRLNGTPEWNKRFLWYVEGVVVNQVPQLRHMSVSFHKTRHVHFFDQVFGAPIIPVVVNFLGPTKVSSQSTAGDYINSDEMTYRLGPRATSRKQSPRRCQKLQGRPST